MVRARIRLGYELNNSNAYSLEQTVLHLQNQNFNPEREFFEFLLKESVNPICIRYLKSFPYLELLLKESIDPVCIRHLTNLPYEIAITEADGRLILSTGTELETGGEEGYMKRIQNPRISFHTHPANGIETPKTTPSFADVYTTDYARDKTTFGLADSKGIMAYRKPVYDPDTNTSIINKEARDVMLTYCKNRGVDIFGFGVREGLKKFWDLSDLEKTRLERQFAEDTQMIVDEASWEDKKGLERVISLIF